MVRTHKSHIIYNKEINIQLLRKSLFDLNFCLEAGYFCILVRLTNQTAEAVRTNDYRIVTQMIEVDLTKDLV